MHMLACMCACVLQGVPVIPVVYGSFQQTVDTLHEYVLAAITTAMAWMDEQQQQQQA
jgi:hypothetical protein